MSHSVSDSYVRKEHENFDNSYRLSKPVKLPGTHQDLVSHLICSTTESSRNYYLQVITQKVRVKGEGRYKVSDLLFMKDKECNPTDMFCSSPRNAYVQRVPQLPPLAAPLWTL